LRVCPKTGAKSECKKQREDRAGENIKEPEHGRDREKTPSNAPFYAKCVAARHRNQANNTPP